MSAPHVVLIDNYDSFTWNVYELLSRLGARVSVYRNDEITIKEIEQLNPTHLLISPGPGNPEHDSGVSREVITHFMGKLPIFGICMGLQCMVSAMGGKVESAGEIYHGKTSAITHNNRGCFEGVAQGVSATRYHSLAANLAALPECFEVTARLEGSGIIQGIRHKQYVLEGVQFHPESVLTQEGDKMLNNFLRYNSGEWKNCVRSGSAGGSSILERIYAKRRADVAEESKLPGRSLADIERYLELGLAPSVVDFAQALNTDHMALIAEIKRASPSKGMIAPDLRAPEAALLYAEGGASAISVLTEPHWFHGSLEDLRLVRKVIDKRSPRPAVLRKEFIFSEYQIAEARLAGADSVLLIVKMLEAEELKRLYAYSKKLGMEPLVEVSSEEEMAIAQQLNARIIGVNNRDLHSFEVDMGRTSGIAGQLQSGNSQNTVLAALSGISEPKQAKEYYNQGVRAILVGESLCRAKDPRRLARELTLAHAN